MKQVKGIAVIFAQVATWLGAIMLYSAAGVFLVPEGVNDVFLLYLMKLALFLFFGIMLILVLCRSIWDRNLWEIATATGKQHSFETTDLLLLMLPLTPIVQYILANQDILSPSGTLALLGGSALFLLAVCVIFPMLLRKLFPVRILMIAGMGLSFVVLDMASLSAEFEWHLEGSFPVQVFVLVIGVVLLASFDSVNRTLARYAVIIFFFISLLPVVFAKYNNFPGAAKIENDRFDKLQAKIDAESFKRTPNIYLLVYESYANNQTMAHYGIDNRQQIDWLGEKGFVHYPGAYSISRDSLGSISRLFAMNSKLDKSPRRYTAGDNPVIDIFERNGYTSTAILPHEYMFRNTPVLYSEYFPSRLTVSGLLLAEAIAEGEFRFDVGFNKIHYDAYLKRKYLELSGVTDDRLFYTHNGYPGHSQNSGKCLPNEIALYAERLRRANLEMKRDIETVIKADPEAIVIVAGDHGPYLTKNCTILDSYPKDEIDRVDIQDRLGVLLAIRWPEWVRYEACDIGVLQDVFVAVLAALLDDRSLLDYKIKASSLAEGLNGVTVLHGKILGGIDDGRDLFETQCGVPVE